MTISETEVVRMKLKRAQDCESWITKITRDTDIACRLLSVARTAGEVVAIETKHLTPGGVLHSARQAGYIMSDSNPEGGKISRAANVADQTIRDAAYFARIRIAKVKEITDAEDDAKREAATTKVTIQQGGYTQEMIGGDLRVEMSLDAADELVGCMSFIKPRKRCRIEFTCA